MGPFARNGLSLARNGFRFHGFHSGVNGPGLLLRSLAARLARPFGFSAPLQESVSPNSCGFPASNPLRVPRTTHTTALSVSTPLQEFSLPRDRSVQRLSRPPGPPSEFARFSLAPRNPSIASGLGSSFAIRYDFVGSLFLKPLGTTLNILLNLFRVNGNMIVTIRFQQLL